MVPWPTFHVIPADWSCGRYVLAFSFKRARSQCPHVWVFLILFRCPPQGVLETRGQSRATSTDAQAAIRNGLRMAAPLPAQQKTYKKVLLWRKQSKWVQVSRKTLRGCGVPFPRHLHPQNTSPHRISPVPLGFLEAQSVSLQARPRSLEAGRGHHAAHCWFEQRSHTCPIPRFRPPKGR